MKAVLTRLTDDGKQTLGIFQAWDGIVKVFECKTLEPAWKDNQKKISCITKGEYTVKKHNSPSKGKCFKIYNVPGRDNLLIHYGNYREDTEGCQLVGKDFTDTNHDGLTDITHSKVTLEKMLMYLPEEFKMTIL